MSKRDADRLRRLLARAYTLSEDEWADVDVIAHRLMKTPQGCLDVTLITTDALMALEDEDIAQGVRRDE